MGNDRTEVFNYFMNCRSKVTLTTAALFNGIINQDYVVVHDAPPRVVKEIVGCMDLVSLKADGLYIPIDPQSSIRSEAKPAAAPKAKSDNVSPLKPSH